MNNKGGLFMQKLQCELCGSIEFSKTEDGFFKCESCGCKYSLAEAKKLLGIVETTIGEAEYNRLLDNARKQIELGQDSIPTLKGIIKEFPGEPEPYIMLFKEWYKHNFSFDDFMISIIDEGFATDYSKAAMISEGIFCVKTLYKMAESSGKVTEKELDELFEDFAGDVTAVFGAYLDDYPQFIPENFVLCRFMRTYGINYIPYRLVMKQLEVGTKIENNLLSCIKHAYSDDYVASDDCSLCGI